MGGGNPIRTAAKMAALGGGLAGSAFRGGDHLSASWSKGSIPASTLSSSSSGAARESSSVQTLASWEIVDEWEFAEEIPRVVFGPVPSYCEAEEATTELKEAVEQVYLSPENSSKDEASCRVAQGAGLASLEKTDCLETNSCISATSPSLPSHALQAFKFLSETPTAQNVVASVASDPNVWNAVLQNPALVEFMRSCKINDPVPNEDVNSGESSADDIGRKHTVIEKLSNLSQPGNTLNDLMDIFENIKLSVLQMVSRVSDFFQDIFGSHVDEKSPSADGNWQPTVGASVMGLAVLAIMVVVLKRN